MSNQNKKLRVAVVGCGMIYLEHIPAFRELSDKVEIVALVDNKPEALEKAGKLWDMPQEKLFSDWKTMLAQVKPDAVDICLPNRFHYPCALDSFAANCHVYCEKPLGMNVAECEDMIAKAKAKNLKLAVGFQQEYNPGSVILVNARKTGFFGEMRYIHASLLRRRGIPNWGEYYSREFGGGPVLDVGVHLLDIATYIVDRPKPKRISATYFYNEGKGDNTIYCGGEKWNNVDYNVEDLAAAQITFENNLVIQLETSYVNHIKENTVYDFKLTGSKGGAWWQSGKIPELYSDMFGAMMNIVPSYLPSQGRPDMFRKKLDNWVDGCLKNSELLLPGEVGLYVQTILDGIALAAATQKEIVL
ncbi:MAG: Gfo/Idh/MocA family oxidoreductase [Victivallales bacterium]|jgi:predicted dehydrogenase|nr:Gfo/Idh/MocA family oxidoreductase [Victivallales bacterium]